MLKKIKTVTLMIVVLLLVAASGCFATAPPASVVLTPAGIANSANAAAATSASTTPVPTLADSTTATHTPLPTATPTLTPTPLPTSTPSQTHTPPPTSTATPLPFDFTQAKQILASHGLKLRTTSAKSSRVCPIYQFCSTYMNWNETLIVTITDDKSFMFSQQHYTPGSTEFYPIFADLFGARVADAIFQNRGYLSIDGYALKIYTPDGSPYLDWGIWVSPDMTLDMMHATESTF